MADVNIKFYSLFSKRINSTKRPGDDTASTTFSCRLKEATSIMSPTIILDRNSIYSTPNWYYAYIQEFDRYYYIEDWTYAPGVWIASLRLDVLASWRWAIENQELYCVRTSNAANMDKTIIDSKCVTTTEKIVETSPVEAIFHVESMNTGTYVIGISGGNGASGGVNFYAFDVLNFIEFCNRVFDDSSSSQIMKWNTDELSYQLAKGLINPLQYVVSAQWFPFIIESGSLASSIKLGWWEFPCDDAMQARRLLTSSMESYPLEHLTVLNHPATSTIGKWANTSPYTRMTLMFEPFGMIALDPMDFVRDHYLSVSVTVDYVTGEGVLYVGNDPNKSAIVEPLKSVRAQIGVPIMLTQTTRDYLGTATNMLSATIQGAIGNAVGFAQGVTSAIGSLLPQQETTGTQGSCATYANVFPTLVYEFMPIKDIDVDHIGRPCCKNLQMSLIGKGSFFQFSDGDVDIPCSASELEEIKSYLEGGIFYE